MATKSARRKLAREVHDELARYVDKLTPNIEKYAAEKGVSIYRLRVDNLLQARDVLSQLIELETTQ